MEKRFEQFRIASGLSKDDEDRQVSTLLYCLGEEAEDVLASTKIKDDEMKKYPSVLAKFEQFFQVRKNLIFERAKFNRRNQRENESTEEYLTVLHTMVKTCEYGGLQEELLHRLWNSRHRTVRSHADGSRSHARETKRKEWCANERPSQCKDGSCEVTSPRSLSRP